MAVSQSNQSNFRYQKGLVTPANTNVVQYRNPTVVMWWSAAIPGYGHVMLSKYIKGFLLILWEFTVNLNAKVNTAILYTFLGRFDEAVEVVDLNWLLLYIPVYIYSMWDSRRMTIDLNKYALLADMTWASSDIDPVSFSELESNYLDKRKPWLAVFWSLITPGLGHLYVNRLPSGFYILVWMMVVLYFSNTLPAVHYTFSGDFQLAQEVINPQWLIFLPSMYCFAPYDAYLQCDSYNKMMAKQQSAYLMKEYQDPAFKQKSSLFSEGSGVMNVVASFDHSVYLEMAIKELEKHGVAKQDIFTVPLTQKIKPKKNSEIIRSSGFSLLDITFAFGTAFSLFGVIYGFVLGGGPIMWGLIGLFFGWGFGFVLDLLMRKKQYKMKKKKGEGGEVMLVVHCDKQLVTLVKEILFDHYTLGLQVVDEEFKDGVY
ncbi:hypothetical protein [Texcoconibacillus texcoconensis]|uniref:TM2 domain-containing membrane protein YozV n=1 Tax=Texcoconibacillus texcoconensis TaxID=1095777 RepID=A0A840QLY9_9BACI|nr:hypothetical protein [Texcoconibacillus texcoconensis]MBB5172387.1 TM2 domain-containing membrane protein YozV [Texcoconibacillus texcoconensis]